MAEEEVCSTSDSEMSEHTETEEPEHEEQHAGEGAASKKKRRKKKRKKPTASDGSGDQQQPGAEQQQGDKQELDRRFTKALESIKQGEDMWVVLGNANIHDAKARKLSEALKNNESVTSINLSGNHIGDEGISALVAALEAGAASELILLDLRGNALSDAAAAQLAGLQKNRKQLTIESGPLEPEPSPPAAADNSSGGASSSGRGSPKGEGVAGGSGGSAVVGASSNGGAGEGDFRASPMFRRYFQTGGEEEEVGTTEDAEEGDQELPEPRELWQQVELSLEAGQPGIPQLGELLRMLCACLERELPSVPTEQDVPASGMKPHIRTLLEKLPLVTRTLGLVPRQVVLQDRNAQPQPALGTHRLWAAEAVALLLLPSHATIDAAVAQAGLVQQLAALALALDKANVLHCRVLRILQSSLRSSVKQLWVPLFGGDCEAVLPPDCGAWQPLQAALTGLASGAQQADSVSRRASRVGFAADAAKLLLACCDPSNSDDFSAPLHDILIADEEWHGATEPGGPLHALLQEQDGELCGPRPPRIEQLDSDSGELMGLPGGMITGGQLLALLKDMGAMMS